MNPKQRFLAAVTNQKTDRPPVWMMRQAGRISPEYRRIKEKHSTLEMMKSPDLAHEITLIPIRTGLGTEAAIVYSDILMIPDALGMGLHFEKGVGPRFEFALNSPDKFQKLNTQNIFSRLDFVFETIRRCVDDLPADFPVLGFAGAPFTVACYMMAGGSDKTFALVKTIAQNENQFFEKVLDLIAETTIEYLIKQADAGAVAVQLFDTWAGLLSAPDYQKWAKPYSEKIFTALKKQGIPTIHYIKNGTHLIHDMTDLVSSAISIDWRVDIATINQKTKSRYAIQGNLNPDVLLSSPKKIEEGLRKMLKDKGNINKGYIINLGHGVHAETPLENVKFFFSMAKELGEAHAL